MSDARDSDRAVFLGSRIDPSRAADLSEAEYAQLIAGMDTNVMGALFAGASLLRGNGFAIVKLERRAGLASLVVRSRSVSAWLYFQIHRTFAPLLSSERVFWLYAVGEERHSTDGKPGRMQDLNNVAAIREIVDRFAARCIASKEKA